MSKPSLKYRSCPGVWCQPEAARAWLKMLGWKVGARRATKAGHTSIPAPREGELYDLHDVMCEEQLSIKQTVEHIRNWTVGDLVHAPTGGHVRSTYPDGTTPPFLPLR